MSRQSSANVEFTLATPAPQFHSPMNEKATSRETKNTAQDRQLTMDPPPWTCPLPPPPLATWPPPPNPPPPAPPRDGLGALTAGAGAGVTAGIDGFHSFAAGLGFHSFALALSADFFLSSVDVVDDGADGTRCAAAAPPLTPAGEGVIAGVLASGAEDNDPVDILPGGVVAAFSGLLAGTNAGADLLLPLLDATAAAAAAEAAVGFEASTVAVGVFGGGVDLAAAVLLSGGLRVSAVVAFVAFGEGASAMTALAAAAVGPFSPLGGGVDLTQDRGRPGVGMPSQ